VSQRIKQNDYRGHAEIVGGYLSPFVLRFRSYKHGSVEIEMHGFHLIQLAEVIATKLASKRAEAMRECATLAQRVKTATDQVA